MGIRASACVLYGVDVGDLPSDKVLRAAGSVVLAHVLTGEAETDRVAEAGLWGLSEILFARTSVEPVEPQGVDLESDELSVYTFLYWPVTAAQPTIGGKAPAAPPITMFCGVQRFSHIE